MEPVVVQLFGGPHDGERVKISPAHVELRMARRRKGAIPGHVHYVADVYRREPSLLGNLRYVRTEE